MKFHAVAGAWSPCFPHEMRKARSFFVVAGAKVLANFNTRAEAQAFIASRA